MGLLAFYSKEKVREMCLELATSKGGIAFVDQLPFLFIEPQSVALLYSVVITIRLFILTGCCSVANAISKNEAPTNAPPIAELADGAVQAAKTESPLPLPQSMNLESSSDQQMKTQDDQILSLKGPKFVPEASKNITALAGRVASLNCRIKNLDNWTVKMLGRCIVLYMCIYV